MIRRPPRSTRVRSSAASDVYKRQVLGNAQPQEGKSQNRVAVDADVVLPKGILHDILSLQMMDPVNLEDNSEILPIDVEEIGSAPTLSHHLSIGLGQAPLTATSSEVEFAHRLRSAKQVQEYGLDEPSALVPANIEQSSCE